MGKILDCLIAKASMARISKKQLKDVDEMINSLANTAEGSEQAATELSQAMRAREILEQRLSQKDYADNLSLKKIQEANDLVKARLDNLPHMLKFEKIRDPDGGIYAARTFTFSDKAAMLQGKWKGTSWQQVYEGKQRLYGSMAAKALKDITPDYAGLRTHDQLSKSIAKDMWNALYKKEARSEDPIIRNSADGIIGLTKRGGEDFKKLGGDIQLREDYPFGLFSSAEKMRKVHPDYITAEKKWIDDVKSYGLDTNYIQKSIPGLSLADEGQLNNFLKEVYRAEISGGKVRVGNFMPQAIRSVTESRAAHRILRFDNFDGWQTYQDKYGSGGLFSWVMNYVDTIARETASLESYGPRPNSFKNAILQSILSDKRIDPAQASKIDRELVGNFSYSTHGLDVGAWKGVGNVSGGMRNIFSASSLGTAVAHVLLLDRVGISPFASAMLGMPKLAPMVNGLTKFLQQGDRRQLAAEMGYLIDKMILAHHHDVRQIISNDGGWWTKVTGNAANGILTASGMHRAVFAQRLSHLEELGMTLARISESGEYENQAMKTWMEAYGINAKDLQNMREGGMDVKQFESHSIKQINPNQLWESDNPSYRETAQKISGLAAALTETVSPQLNPRALKMFQELQSSNAIGAFVSPLAKSLTSFIGGIYSNLMRPILSQENSMQKWGWLGGFTTWMTTLGVLDVMLRDISQGKDPKALNKDKILQGFSLSGVAGPLGDVMAQIYAQPDVGANDVIGRFLPPLEAPTRMAVNLGKNIANQTKGQQVDWAKTTVNDIRSLTPGQNLWWAGLAVRRWIFDPLLKALDANAPQIFNRQVQSSKQREGQDFWWAPGQPSPQRAPNLSDAFTPYNQPHRGR